MIICEVPFDKDWSVSQLIEAGDAAEVSSLLPDSLRSKVDMLSKLNEAYSSGNYAEITPMDLREAWMEVTKYIIGLPFQDEQNDRNTTETS